MASPMRIPVTMVVALVIAQSACENTEDAARHYPAAPGETRESVRDRDGRAAGRASRGRASRGEDPPAVVSGTKPDAREVSPPARPSQPAGVWDLSHFAPTTDAELEAERTLLREVRELWRQGDFAGAHRRLTAALEFYPARLELLLLRAATVLGAFDAARVPLNALGGRAPPETLPLPALLAMISDLERAFPPRPPLPVPWSGLYHPYAQGPLSGETVRLWARGVGPLFQLRALAAGRIDLFGELETEDFSLVDLVLSAQLAAAQDDAGAVRSLTADLSSRLGEEAWQTWRPRLVALATVCGSLAKTKNDDIAYTALSAWGDAVSEAIPQVGEAVLVLPRPAFDAARAVARGKSLDDVLGAPPEIPGAGATTKLLESFRDTSSDTKDPAAAELETEVLDELFLAAVRWRDFRADCLRRFQSGEAGGVLSPGAVRGGGGREGEARRGTLFLKVSGVGVAFVRKRRKLPEGADAEEIPVSGGSAVWILESR